MSYETLAGATSASVKKHTKKTWDEWIQALDKKSCRHLTHQQLVAVLKKDFKLKPWWQQWVARGYQIAIGVRPPHQTLKGTYTTTVTKTISNSAKKIFTYLLSDEGQEVWLKPLYSCKIKAEASYECEGGVFGEFRTVRVNKALRMTWINEDWPKKSVVQLHLVPRTKNKCMLVIDHTDLPTLRAKTEMHGRWRKAVDELAELLNENSDSRK